MSALRRLLRGENNYNFVRLWKIGLRASAALVVISLLTLVFRGIERGIDFEGGTSWEVPTKELSVAQARDVLRPLGLATAKIQSIGSNTLRVQAETKTEEETAEVRIKLAEAASVAPTDVAVTQVGPSWGGEISRKAIRALVFFFIAIAIYITLALREWRMAVGALLAVVHDILISVGFYSLFRFEVTPATVIAFLTILGFSLYDTVVVFSKLRENSAKFGLAGRMTYTDLASLSTNQVLMRSINTTLTALMPVICILVVGAFILGATTLEEFGIALLVGLISGAYSSIFIATPIVAWLKEREPTNRTLRERLAKEEKAQAGAPMADANDEATPRERVAAAAGLPAARSALPPGYSAAHPPRPRKKGRR